MRTQRYDLAIVGAGSVGLIAADYARKFGARVVLLERDRIGGDCTWTGCVPSKSLLKAAKVIHTMRTAARFGVDAQTPIADMQKVREYLDSTIEEIYAGTTPEALQQKGVDVLFGAVSFIDSRTLAVADKRVRAKKILIATGAAPLIAHIPGLKDVPFYTYREIFQNDRLPQTMAVIGGGPVGVEIAQAYQRLGTHVTLYAERLLTKEEPEASEILASVLHREGVQLVPERPASVARNGNAVRVHLQKSEADFDLLFVAVGRKPVVDGLNLEAAGVKYSARGIKVNDHLQTSRKNIYAAGDVIGGPQFSHLAGWQGFQAVRNALLPGAQSGFSCAVPRVTFTDPEVAQVGLTENEARARYAQDVVVASWPIARADRAICDGDAEGRLKFITRRNGAILGATIVAHRAGEAITEVAVAMQNRIRIGQLAQTIHPYPTYSSAVQLLASEMAMDRALDGPSGYLIRILSKIFT
ncbi:MAG: FAD-dependent oxidoreductase [Vulcanimicrobiaceae bacterium]